MALVQLRPRSQPKRTRQKRKLRGDPKYYDRIGRYGHWQPAPTLRKIGYRNVCCGLDGPEAIAIAENMNRQARARKAQLQRLQTLRFELQTELRTQKFEFQTKEFESSDGIQTSQFELRTRRWLKSPWLRSFVESDVGIGIIVFLLTIG